MENLGFRNIPDSIMMVNWIQDVKQMLWEPIVCWSVFGADWASLKETNETPCSNEELYFFVIF